MKKLYLFGLLYIGMNASMARASIESDRAYNCTIDLGSPDGVQATNYSFGENGGGGEAVFFRDHSGALEVLPYTHLNKSTVEVVFNDKSTLILNFFDEPVSAKLTYSNGEQLFGSCALGHY